MTFQEVMERVGRAVDMAGVGVIVLGIAAATVVALVALAQRQPGVYERYRRWLGRSILLGLEILVAADIIRTVAVTPTLGSVAVLAIVVLVRTFLSFSLELEITGRWPWEKPPTGRVPWALKTAERETAVNGSPTTWSDARVR